MTMVADEFRDLRAQAPSELSTRDRILRTAVLLFNEHGVHTVGIDRIIAESGVAKKSLYNHFASKTALISAYLDFRDRLRFSDLERHVAKVQGDPKAEILAIFDSLEAWFFEKDFNGCPFIRGLNDFSDAAFAPLREQVDRHFGRWGGFVQARLETLVEPERASELLPQILSLITGSATIALVTGDPKIARSNRKIAETLLGA